MTLQRITTLSFCACATLLVSACDLGDKSIGNDTNADGETGDGDGDPTGDGDPDPTATGDGDGDDDPPSACGEQTTTVVPSLNAILPGFEGDAAAYIAAVEGEFTGQFDWLPNDGFVTTTHADSSSALSMSVTYDGGEIRLIEVANAGDFPDGDPGGVPCQNRVEIDLTLGFTTADGLFAEAFAIPITVSSHDELALPGFYFSLDMDLLQGQLSLDDFSISDGVLTDIVLLGSFADATVGGSLNLEIETMDWVGFGSVATFTATRQP